MFSLSGTVTRMKPPGNSINRLILDELAHGEMRSHRLVVAVRKAIRTWPVPFKGNLSAAVNTALRGLVNSKAIRDTDGTYTLVRD
jgi:hypothetical protein